MGQCYKSGDFYKYFKENMNALGMPAPDSLFGTYNAAIANASLILGTFKTLGSQATMAEIIGATTGLEALGVAAALGAAGYAGAVVGSIAVASGRSLSCGSRIADMFAFIEEHDLQFPGWKSFYLHNPQIFDTRNPHRYSFAVLAKASPASFEYA
ncbi:hypothetical protein EUZ85_23350 [Hahella sp. KA22]|uniref:hypothetical protein n=1 Tax=Hahella sp. KA22 TaxID=1628392 RepID=UPI000FDE7AF4|nr:hypothetical protein [Hahella sp. KA22]AZZ93498.1 hypothetical protein ENC22_20770 [Hahella sp. KA22]QAY56872.1 hypothetical protein EUZ85_23350 [Hahella sp. KA22]